MGFVGGFFQARNLGQVLLVDLARPRQLAFIDSDCAGIPFVLLDQMADPADEDQERQAGGGIADQPQVAESPRNGGRCDHAKALFAFRWEIPT